VITPLAAGSLALELITIKKNFTLVTMNWSRIGLRLIEPVTEICDGERWSAGAFVHISRLAMISDHYTPGLPHINP
jgi:hypothetical protein